MSWVPGPLDGYSSETIKVFGTTCLAPVNARLPDFVLVMTNTSSLGLPDILVLAPVLLPDHILYSLHYLCSAAVES